MVRLASQRNKPELHPTADPACCNGRCLANEQACRAAHAARADVDGGPGERLLPSAASL